MSHSGEAGPPGASASRGWPDREDHPKEWWGQIHPRPAAQDPDRLHIFVRPGSMSQAEQDSILSRWKASVGDAEENIQSQGLSHHLRPSTPPSQRAEKKIQRLREAMGGDVSEEAKKVILDHCQANYGLIESLRHYSQGETHIPVAYANELIQMIERLMLETATQMSVASRNLRVAAAVEWDDEVGQKMADVQEQLQFVMLKHRGREEGDSQSQKSTGSIVERLKSIRIAVDDLVSRLSSPSTSPSS